MKVGRETQPSLNQLNLHFNLPFHIYSGERLLSPLDQDRSKTVKGALGLVRSNPKTSPIDLNPLRFVFQYNPEMLGHLFSSPNSEEAAKQEQQSGANTIVELINLSLELDANDQLEQPNLHEEIVEYGLHPTLATLASIMLSQSKTHNSTSPIVLFTWGPNRTIPVSLENVKILEESFDTRLNPIRAKIELVMKVLNLEEFSKGSTGYDLCLDHLDRRKMFTQKFMRGDTWGDFSKHISNNIRSARQLGKTKRKSDVN